jgi:hypothetical protein
MTAGDTPAAVSPYDLHVFLAGRPPMAEFITFVKKSSPNGSAGEAGPADSRLADDWRSAHDHLRRLEESEAGWADHAILAPLPAEMETHGARLRSDPVFRRTHGAVPTEIALVELDRLVVFQKHINLAHVAIIQRELGPSPTPGAIAQVALGLDRYSPPVRLMHSHEVFTFVCDSRDFRFIEPILLPAELLPALACRGVAAQAVAFAVGFSPNCLTAIQAGGRLILFNGSHRAYAMRELGITHLPCVIQKTSRPEEIELIAHKEIGQRGDLYLKNPRPPLLKDYFDDRLRRIVPITRSHRLVRVQLRIDQSDIPGD